jgi:hypothetical protein
VSVCVRGGEVGVVVVGGSGGVVCMSCVCMCACMRAGCGGLCNVSVCVCARAWEWATEACVGVMFVCVLPFHCPLLPLVALREYE